jgi:DHA1 family bicyclomycin/chloramphenicol resistance-like MFS transporter
LYLLIGAAAYTCLLVWLTTGPFILQNLYGLTPLQFAVTFTLCAFGYLAGNLFATRRVLRVGIVRMIGYGASIMVAGGTIVCLLIILDLASVVTLVAAMAITLVGFGTVFPLALAGGLSCFSDRAGAASSLLGFSPQFMAAIVCTVVAFAMGRSIWVAGIAILTMTLVVFGLWLLLRRASRPAPQ